jgi:hypothetical protein
MTPDAPDDPANQRNTQIDGEDDQNWHLEIHEKQYLDFMSDWISKDFFNLLSELLVSDG